MAIDFPATPALNQQITVSGMTWQWDGIAWNVVPVMVAAIVQDSPPANPASGQFWWRGNGQLYIWVVDPTSSQWVQAVPGNNPQIGTANVLNRIVNGGFQHSQESSTISQTGVGAYPADQWVYVFGGVTGSSTALTLANPNYVRVWSGGAFTPVAGSYGYLYQPVEGFNVRDFFWGGSGAVPVVLRFKARTAGATLPTTVLGVAVRNATSDRSYVRNFAITSTFQDFVMPIPGCKDGAWPVDNTAGLYVSFAGMIGSTYVAPSAGSWLTGNYLAASGIGNIYSAASQGFDIADVGLYLDPLATGLPPRWDVPDYGQELLRCQRYWIRHRLAGIPGRISAQRMPFMRVPPTTAIVNATIVENDQTHFIYDCPNSSAIDTTSNSRM